MQMYRDSQYGLSAVGFGAALIFFLFLYMWSGVFEGGDVPVTVTFFNIIFIGSLIGIIGLKTLSFGYTGTDRGSWLLYGLILVSFISIIFGFFTAAIVYETLQIVLMAAIAEEFFVRGFIYPYFKRIANNFVVSSIASSFIWVLLHVVAYGINLLAFFQLFCTSMVLCFILERSKSLDVPILVHFLNNLLVALIFVGVV